MSAATRQHDLFASPDTPADVPKEFVAQQRAELDAMLALARGAKRLPWSDYTQSALAELRFDGLARWLPASEAEAMRAAFAAELDRLYALEPQPPA